jgi:hypothetical protein
VTANHQHPPPPLTPTTTTTTTTIITTNSQRASYGDGFGREDGTVGLFQNCEAEAPSNAEFVNALRPHTGHPTFVRIEEGDVLELHVT